MADGGGDHSVAFRSMIIVQAGNRIDVPGRGAPRFPPDRVPDVARRVAELLDVLRPDGLVTAMAAGADLLFAQAAMERGLPLHVVLPFDSGRFRAESVEDQGGRWVEAYDAVLDHVRSAPDCSLEELDLTPDVVGYRAGNDGLLERARALGGRRVLAVAVRPRASTEGSVVDDFVAKAEGAGLFVLEVDPLRLCD